jgi:hypothetical protein
MGFFFHCKDILKCCDRWGGNPLGSAKISANSNSNGVNVEPESSYIFVVSLLTVTSTPCKASSKFVPFGGY